MESWTSTEAWRPSKPPSSSRQARPARTGSARAQHQPRGLAPVRGLPRRDPRGTRAGARHARDRETPQRLLRALFDSTSGYDGDPKLLTTFPSESKEPGTEALGQIVEGPIAFHALCEHHALPFYGVAHVGYVAGEEIIGISKLTRLVRLFTKRFTVQERVGEQIADTLMS